MNVLVLGGGGREAALVYKLSQSKKVTRLFCAPGNAGIASLAEIVPIPVDAVDQLLQFSKENQIDLTVVGPELPLSLGVVDRFEMAGLRIFGPSRLAAQIETSKGFSKLLMRNHHIPTPHAEVVSIDEATRRIETSAMPIVLKVDGLAAGKGVVIAQTVQEARAGLEQFRTMGEGPILLEQYVTGVEATFFVLADGETGIPLTSAKDYKRIFDGDQGPNTGGMGAVSPSPNITPDIEREVMSKIVHPTLKALAGEGIPYRGVLYVGLMLTDAGPLALEFNARFGDPEAQAVLPRLKTDLMDLIEATLDHRLDQLQLEWSDETAVCVVLAAEGYPGTVQRGDLISGLDTPRDSGTMIFHAGTQKEGVSVVTAGGRVLGVTSLGPNRQTARERVYQAVDHVSFRGMQYRKEIGQ
jgi:phosphoribosylamine--glycine ligase